MFALDTTRTARCYWGNPFRTELRARCIDQKRRAEFASADALQAMGGEAAAAAADQLVEAARWSITQVKTVFLRHLYIITMILPRQARDKHRESTQT